MSSRVTTPSVQRRYHVAPDYCARALELLLKNSTRKKGTRPGAPEDAERRSSDGAKTIIRKRL